MSQHDSPLAGLSYAPPYDKTSELDPKSVHPVLISSGDLSKLEYFQQLHARHTLWARAVLLVVIFGMLAVNMWLTQRNYTAVVVNMDQARMAQSDIDEANARRLADLSTELQALRADMAALKPAATPATTSTP